jgi:hypothetical protein
MASIRVLAALCALASSAQAFAPGPAAPGRIGLHARGVLACSAGSLVPSLRSAAARPPPRAKAASRRSGRPATGLRMQTEKSASTQFIIGFLAFGFLFGALFPLINNGLRVGTAGDEMSGAATGMRQKELDSRLSKVNSQHWYLHLRCGAETRS